MKAVKKITVVGAGNVGSHLAIALFNNGYKIQQVYSRTKKKANDVAQIVKAQPITNLSELDNEVDLILIAVKDDAIEVVANTIEVKTVLIAHTSGSVPQAILASAGYEKYGIFYPLQSFNKDKPMDFSTVPICLEANSVNSLNQLKNIAENISNQVYEISSKEREVLHLAAVFANNFSNFMFQLAEQITEEHQLPFELLIPLIEETANKIKTSSPKDAQTGPAIRNDEKTIRKHLTLLENSPPLKNLYSTITQQIINSAKQKT